MCCTDVTVRAGRGLLFDLPEEKITCICRKREFLATLWPVFVFPAVKKPGCYHNKLLKEEENTMDPMIFMRAVVISALLAVPGWSQAATYSLFASLDGLQEVPPVATPGTGTGVMTYDDVSNLLSWNITFSDLIGTTTDAHFHGPAAFGVSAGVQVPISIPLGVTSGMASGSATISDTQETQLLSDLWYINIHTNFKTGGEIRGQVQVVPIPAAVWLFGSGLLGLAALARRRKS
jgi:hypothetical protein